jgi:ankyrin repeat protein
VDFLGEGHETTPLHNACENCHLDIAILLLDGAKLDRAKVHGETLLSFACSQQREEGYLEVARLLLDRGADVDKSDHRGRTPLFYPCVKGHLQVVKLLLMGGASAVVKADPARPFQADANALLKQWRTTPPARWEAVHRQGCWEYVDAPYEWTPENHAQYPTAFRASVQARISALGILVAMQGPLATFKEALGPLAEMIATGLHREMGLHRGASAEFSAPS